MNLSRIPFLQRLIRFASVSRAGARTGFVRLQRIEGLFSIALAVPLLLAPAELIRMVSGVTASGLALLDPAQLVRLLGLGMLAAAALNIVSSFRGISSRRVMWAGALAHASASMVR